MKHYLINLTALGKTLEEADAIEWALFKGMIKLAYVWEADQKVIEQRLPEILEAYRRTLHEKEALS